MNGEWIRQPFKTQRAVIVFVHGVLSSGASCWANKNGTTWPRLVIQDKEMENSAVFVFSYRSALTGGRYSISDAADALWLELQSSGILDLSDPIIFVCHSMGGIVVRRLVVKRQKALPPGCTLGLFLVASPSIGSFWATLLYPLIWIVHHSQASALRLSESNEWLRDLKTDFRMVLDCRSPFIVGRELIEERSVVLGCVSWIPPVVRKVEGEVFFSDPLTVPASDHFSIAKPRDGAKPQHKALRQFVNRVVERSSQVAFKVPPDWRFDEAVVAISSIDNMSAKFVGFAEHELGATSQLETRLEGISTVDVLAKLRGAFIAGSVAEYLVERDGSTVILTKKKPKE